MAGTRPLREGLAGLVGRVRPTIALSAQAASGAALAWFLAHRVLHHPQPFFAPIAAAITLSTTHRQRTRRVVQLVTGVLLGIAAAEALKVLLGYSTLALGLIVFAAVVGATVGGKALIGEGMLLVNQSAASAILVVTLHRPGIGGDRAIDALVGGGVAFALAVLIFPTDPIGLLSEAEGRVLRSLGETLLDTAGFLATTTEPPTAWLAARRTDAYRQLAELARCRATADSIAQISPRRWHLRAVVAAEIDRLTQTDALVDDVVAVAHTANSALSAAAPLPGIEPHKISLLADALSRLSATHAPWRAEVLPDVRATINQPLSGVSDRPRDRATALTLLVDAIAVDIAAVAADPRSPVTR
jgi:uncharacterized membrane protein YgaE (UPF0421/DUF939 family)